MSTPAFLLASGYYHKAGSNWASWFHGLWWRNLIRWARPDPDTVVIIASDGSKPFCSHPNIQWVVLSGNAGHCDDLLAGVKPYQLPSCPCTWLAAAFMAYSNESDLIVREQDVLCFGDWVGRMYSELGDRSALFGVNKMQGCATSLFLIKHRFLPQFVMDYLSEGPENKINRIAETKVLRLIQRKPEDYGQYTFGVDKDKPITPDAEVWFGQKFTPEELRQLEAKGLISCEGMPENVEVFSNHA